MFLCFKVSRLEIKVTCSKNLFFQKSSKTREIGPVLTNKTLFLSNLR